MTPEPAPYGAYLPRPATPGPWGTEDRRHGALMVVRADTPPGLTIDVAECGSGDGPAIAALPEYVTALGAANAEVLALREKLGASQDLAELLGKLYEGLVDVVHAVVHEDIRHGAQEAIELLLNSLDGRDLLPPDYPELPAPTEGDG